jgi:hypothetical protein
MTFRFDNTDVHTWKERAAEQGLTLTEWIRRRCNESGAGNRGVEVVQPAVEVPASERRKSASAGAGEGIAKYSQVGSFTAEELMKAVHVPDFLPLLSPNICANCEHPKKKHGGFGTCCQEDNCACPKFE